MLKKQNYHYLRTIYPRLIILIYCEFEAYFTMQLLNMPLFELFLPVIQSNSIQNWTANDFWKQMKLTKKVSVR